MIFNFRRNEVRSFLLGAAYHWLRRYHIDGLRIDAVSSMIYKNHCRAPVCNVPLRYFDSVFFSPALAVCSTLRVFHRIFAG